VKVKYVTTVPRRQPVPEFDVSFPEKLLKIVAILGYIFCLKFSKLAFGGRAPPGPAGGAKALPQTPSRN